MSVAGTEGLTQHQVMTEIQKGGKFVTFPYTISIVVLTFSRTSEIKLIKAGQGTFGTALPYLLISFFFGWWGFPFGIIYTPISLVKCLAGGNNVTAEVIG